MAKGLVAGDDLAVGAEIGGGPGCEAPADRRLPAELLIHPPLHEVREGNRQGSGCLRACVPGCCSSVYGRRSKKGFQPLNDISMAGVLLISPGPQTAANQPRPSYQQQHRLPVHLLNLLGLAEEACMPRLHPG